MAISVTHAKVSGRPAGADATRIYGTHWDANHVVPQATALQAVAGESDDVVMTPLRVTNWFEGQASTGTGSIVFSTSPTLVTPALGTPSAVVLTNATGLPATSLTGLGAGVSDFLATPSSANLAAAVTGETGSGALVFATSPTLVTPTIGVATATSINGNAFTAGTGTLTLDTYTLTVTATASVGGTHSGTSSGTNTGDQTISLTGDVTGSGTGSFAASIGATKVTSAMLNADVFSTAHSWGGQQTFTAPILGAATGSSLALNGATLGSYKLAVTGDSYFGGTGKFIGSNTAAITTDITQFTVQNSAYDFNDVFDPVVPPGWFMVDGIRSVVEMPAGSTPTNVNALGLYAISNNNPGVSTTGNMALMYGLIHANANDAAVWGLNPVLSDSIGTSVTSGTGKILAGMEIDFSVTSPNTVIQGISLLGTSVSQPTGANGFTVGSLSVSNPGTAYWGNAFVVEDNVAEVGMVLGAYDAAGVNISGIPIRFAAYDSASVGHYLDMKAIPTGSGTVGLSLLDNFANANGFVFKNNTSGNAPEIYPQGTDTNIGMKLTPKGSGVVTVTGDLTVTGTLTASAVLPTLTDGYIWVGNASNSATAVLPSGDVTITNAGVTAIGATKVTSAMLNSDVFSTAHSWSAPQTMSNDLIIANTEKLSWASDLSSQYIKYDATLDGLQIEGYAGLAFMTTGGSEKARLTQAGYFGVGTTGPQAALQVTISSAASGAVGIFTNSGITDGNAVNLYLGKTATGAAGETGIIQYRPNTASPGSAYLAIGHYGDTLSTASLVIEKGGEVGIGTTTPGYNLHVVGTLGVSGALTYGGVTLTAGVTGTGKMVLDTSPVITNISPGANFTLTQNSVAAITSVNSGAVVNTLYLSAGKVGIGTASPGTKIDARGTRTGAGSGANQYIGALYSTDALGAGVGGGLALGGVYTGTSTTEFAQIAGVKENATDGNYGGALAISTRPNGGAITEVVRIDSAGAFGIGTTTPGYNLHVVGTTHITGNLTVGGTYPGGAGASQWTTSGADIYYNAGSVGVGVTSPQGKLGVVDASRAATDANSGAGLLKLSTGTGALTDESLIFGVHDSDYAWIQAVKAGTANRDLAINPNGGNVGIGNTAPGQKLHLYGAGSPDLYVKVETGTGPSLLYGASAGGIGLAGTFSAHDMVLFTNSAERVRIDSAGSIGLGTSTPGQLLHLYAAGSPDLYQKIETGTGPSLLYGASSSGVGVAGTFSAHDMTFWTNSSERMRITSAGNVGIGMTPTKTLDITGTLGVSGALTYGGVTLTANVTGTGKMVLDTSPTLVTPALGVATGTTLAINSGLLAAQGGASTASKFAGIGNTYWTSSGPADWTNIAAIDWGHRFLIGGFPNDGTGEFGAGTVGIYTGFLVGLDVPSTIDTTSYAPLAISGIGRTYRAGTPGVVGVYGQGLMAATGSTAWGSNFLIANGEYSTDVGSGVVGMSGCTGYAIEVNINQFAGVAGASVSNYMRGIYFNSGGGGTNTHSMGLVGMDFDAADTGSGPRPWNYALYTQDASIADYTGTYFRAISLGVTGTANNLGSQAIEFRGRNSGGTAKTGNINMSPDGYITANPPSGAGFVVSTGNAYVTSGYISVNEMTAPSSAGANGCYIYAEDNGSGKTRLMAKFSSGAAQQIALEP